jgi:hypothetical protein
VPVDSVAEANRERDRQLRELGDQAHGVNLDLGAGLLTGLSTVDPQSMDVARFFVLCRPRHRTNYADRLAMPIGVTRRDVAGRGLRGGEPLVGAPAMWSPWVLRGEGRGARSARSLG